MRDAFDYLHENKYIASHSLNNKCNRSIENRIQEHHLHTTK